jgi:hypothetical protein
MGVHIIYLLREISKPALKLDFTAHGIMKSLSEFGLLMLPFRKINKKLKSSFYIFTKPNIFQLFAVSANSIQNSAQSIKAFQRK